METFFRHERGNGKKYEFSEACPSTYLSKTSSLRGASDVFESIIENTEADQIIDSFIYGAQIFNSTVINTKIAGRVRVENSLLACKSVAGAARVANSVIEGESRISGAADISNSSFRNLSVGGTARILDWNLFFKESKIFDGLHGRIREGVWRRPPRIERFDDLEITVTESTGGRAFIGCLEKPIKQWIAAGHRFGRANGWTKEQVESVIRLLAGWQNSSNS